MGFNSGFKGLILIFKCVQNVNDSVFLNQIIVVSRDLALSDSLRDFGTIYSKIHESVKSL